MAESKREPDIPLALEVSSLHRSLTQDPEGGCQILIGIQDL
jgi:hypothetical protein